MKKRIFDVEKHRPKPLILWRSNKALNMRPSLWVMGVVVVLLLAFGSIRISFSPTGSASAQEVSTSTESVAEPTTSATDDKEQRRNELETQLADLEKQIFENQKTIEQYQKQGSTLKNEIGTLNTKINKLTLQIKAVNLSLTKLGQEINATQSGINQTENRIDKHKGVISDALQALYEADSQSLMEVLLANDTLSDFFGNLTNVALVQNNLRVALADITKLRQDLVEKKEQYNAQLEDAENLRAIQQSQKKTVESTQKEKSKLLTVTKGKESEYQKIQTKTKETAAQIRSQIFELLGGGELTFEKAYDYAYLAERATGVRAALTLSILNRESLLGKNVGRCNYQTAMHPTRDKPYFLDLMKRLDLDPDSDFSKVSCANQHGSYGGAMGPAQFIPSTWKLYEEKIARVTGNAVPSPWNNADAFAATALYMSDLLASASCREYANANKNVLPYQSLLERCAAAKYYSGSRWYTYRMWYGEPVVVQANEFENKIAIIRETS